MPCLPSSRGRGWGTFSWSWQEKTIKMCPHGHPRLPPLGWAGVLRHLTQVMQHPTRVMSILCSPSCSPHPTRRAAIQLSPSSPGKWYKEATRRQPCDLRYKTCKASSPLSSYPTPFQFSTSMPGKAESPEELLDTNRYSVIVQHLIPQHVVHTRTTVRVTIVTKRDCCSEKAGVLAPPFVLTAKYSSK